LALGLAAIGTVMGQMILGRCEQQKEPLLICEIFINHVREYILENPQNKGTLAQQMEEIAIR
jgi:hypothetical protein